MILRDFETKILLDNYRKACITVRCVWIPSLDPTSLKLLELSLHEKVKKDNDLSSPDSVSPADLPTSSIIEPVSV
jgi:hypothetical protein